MLNLKPKMPSRTQTTSTGYPSYGNYGGGVLSGGLNAGWNGPGYGYSHSPYGYGSMGSGYGGYSGYGINSPYGHNGNFPFGASMLQSIEATGRPVRKLN